MINMISVNTFDALGKSNLPLDDSPDTDSGTDLFASFLVVPVSMPPVNTPVADQLQAAKPETGTSVSSVELQPDVFGPKNRSVLLETNISGIEGLIGSGDENTFVSAFSPPAFAESQPIGLVPENTGAQSITAKLVDPFSLPADSDTGQGDEGTNVTAPTGISGALPLPSEFSQHQVFDEVAHPIRPGAEAEAPLSEISQQEIAIESDATPTRVADGNFSNSAIRQPDFSYEPLIAKPILPFQLKPASDPKQPDLPDAPSMTTPTLSFPQNVLSDPGQKGIMAELPKEADVNIRVDLIVPKPLTPPFSADVSKVFKDVSSIVRDDNSLKANIGSSTPSEQSIADLVKQELTGDGSNSLDRSVIEPLIPDEKVKVADRGVEAVFNASLNEAVKTLNLTHSPATETIAREKVMEQVEPRMMEFAAAMQSGGEKRVLKIRLTPPDLGTVEVTLQKSASGKIDAHFQTESHETRHILNEGLMQLRESLERSGMRVGELDISFGSFSSTGNENRRDQSHKFGTAEVLSADTINFDGISKDEDDAGDRLVNLRA